MLAYDHFCFGRRCCLCFYARLLDRLRLLSFVRPCRWNPKNFWPGAVAPERGDTHPEGGAQAKWEAAAQGKVDGRGEGEAAAEGARAKVETTKEKAKVEKEKGKTLVETEDLLLVREVQGFGVHIRLLHRHCLQEWSDCGAKAEGKL